MHFSVKVKDKGGHLFFGDVVLSLQSFVTMFDMELSRSPCCLRPMLLFTGAKQIYFVFVILPAAVSRRLRIRQRLAQAEDS